MEAEDRAQGWFQDPFGIHQDRWYSQGVPSNLVRDGTVESHDDPPQAVDPGPLVPAAPRAARDDQQQAGPPKRSRRRWYVGAALLVATGVVVVIATAGGNRPTAASGSSTCSTSGTVVFNTTGPTFDPGEPRLAGVRLTRDSSGITAVWRFDASVNPTPSGTAQWLFVYVYPGPGVSGGPTWSPLEVIYGHGRWTTYVQLTHSSASGSDSHGVAEGRATVSGATVVAHFPVGAVGPAGTTTPFWWNAVQGIFGSTPAQPIIGSSYAAAACPAPASGFTPAAEPVWSNGDYVRFPAGAR
jgi:hypothetical protein